MAKGGTSTLIDVYDYAERVTAPGFVFMNTPGYDPVSLTGLAAGGCNLIAFTTGRGSAIGFPTIPVIKIATNSHTFRAHAGQHGHQRRRASPTANRTVQQVGREIFDLVLEVASGRRTCAERLGHKEFVPVAHRSGDVARMKPDALEKAAALPLHSHTPAAWGAAVLADPVALLIDHAFLEKKAANNALELMTRWPSDWVEGWVETMTAVARDEAAHLAQVTRLLIKRGGRLERIHKNPYANALRLLVRKGGTGEVLDRLLISALIEARSCERFAVLAGVSADAELAAFYHALFSSEMGHYKVFLRLARKVAGRQPADARWQELLAAEARILARQDPGPRIHSCPAG